MAAARREVDFELGLPSRTQPKRLEGYPSFADFIARDSDAAIYRKYSHMSARNLLYLQSELHELEAELQHLDAEDAKETGSEDAQKTARDWSHYSDPANERSCQHRRLQEKIRVGIKQYHEALFLESRILTLNAPSPRTLEAFRRWFRMTSVPVLWGRDQHLFDDARDLVALAPVDNDRLNTLLKTYFGWFFKQGNDGNPSSNDLFYYSHRSIQTAGAVISVLSSAVLLIGAIASLLFTVDRGMRVKVGVIVLFTCLFALVVGLLTNARRAEIFGATAAYAAVLVVFVGNNFSDNGGKPG
ncbi:MAG: hypothetical protein Q9209_006331 [Squamulea sp. 1 TL-2023]